MTAEDDFHAALDANPDDWQTRLVFADWLDERGDERAEGYRALGVLRLRPLSGGRGCWWHDSSDRHGRSYNSLPTEWFRAFVPHNQTWSMSDPTTRREAEDAAALAFALLPEARRAELLHTATPNEARV